MSLCYLLCLCKYTDFSLKQTNEFISLSRQTHLNYTDYHLQQHYTSSKDCLWIPQNVYPKGSVLQKSNASALIVPYLDFINKHFFHHEWHYGLCGR